MSKEILNGLFFNLGVLLMLNSLLSAAVIIVPVSVPHGHFTALFTFSGVVRLARAPIHIIDLEFKSHLATYARSKRSFRLISRCKIEIIRITLLKSAHSKPHPGPRQSRLIPIRGQSRLYNFCENQFRLKLYWNTLHSLPPWLSSKALHHLCHQGLLPSPKFSDSVPSHGLISMFPWSDCLSRSK